MTPNPALERQAPPESVALALRNVHKAFDTKQILRGVTLEVERGTSAVVLGGSGSGKSVLIKHVVRLLEPDSGTVWVLGQRLDMLSDDEMDALRLEIGYLFQSGALFDSMTVFENLDFLLCRHKPYSAAERRGRIEMALAWVKLPKTAQQYPSELSGGQRKRIALARAIVMEPVILLYDEPTTGLDPASVQTVSHLITRLRDEHGITSIAITHDILCADIIADRAFFLHEGRIVASGTMDELRHSEHPVAGNFFGPHAYLR